MYCWKMLRPLTLAALCLTLASAAPAYGQTLGPPDERASRPDVRLQVSSRIAPSDSTAPHPTPEAHLFEGVRPGIGITRQTIREQNGTASVASGLVRSWAVTEGVSAGVGLFSVTHEDQKEPEFRRSWSAKNVGPRNRKVAAVGLNVRF